MVILFLWLAEVGHLLLPSPAWWWPSVLALLALAALSLPTVRPGTRWLAGALFLPAIPLALFEGKPALLLDGLELALVYPAFLCTIVVVRAAAAVHPAISRARERVAALAPRERESGFLLASHLFGAVVTAGSFAILAPLLGRETPEAERAALAIAALRGSCLAVLWSPFFVGMALVTQYMPAVPLWHIALMGLALAAIGFAISLAQHGVAGLRGLPAAFHALWPTVPPVALAASLIILVSTLAGTKTLHTVLLVVPPLVAGWLAFQPSTARREALRQGWANLARLGEEILVIVAVTILSGVLAHSSWTGLLAAPLHAGYLPPVVLLGLLLAAIVAIAVLGVHPMATVAIILAVLVDGGSPIAPLALAGLGLLGWALGTMIGTSSLSLLVASSSFAVARSRLSPGPNGRFALLFGLAAVSLLGIVDAWLG